MKFNENPKVMVITTKNIICKQTIVKFVFHDEEDGMWQFLDGINTDENNAAIISLEEMLSIDATVEQIADLPLGWVAWRNNLKSKWSRKANG